MEFITESSNMTELIMRSDAIRELTNYQQEKLKELEDLIKENEQLQVDMKKYQVTLEKILSHIKMQFIVFKIICLI